MPASGFSGPLSSVTPKFRGNLETSVRVESATVKVFPGCDCYFHDTWGRPDHLESMIWLLGFTKDAEGYGTTAYSLLGQLCGLTCLTGRPV